MLFSLLGGFLQSVLLRMCVAMMLLLHHKCGMTQHASLEGKRFTSFEALKLSSLEHTVSWTSWLKRQWMGETWFLPPCQGQQDDLLGRLPAVEVLRKNLCRCCIYFLFGLRFCPEKDPFSLDECRNALFCNLWPCGCSAARLAS